MACSVAQCLVVLQEAIPRELAGHLTHAGHALSAAASHLFHSDKNASEAEIKRCLPVLSLARECVSRQRSLKSTVTFGNCQSPENWRTPADSKHCSLVTSSVLHALHTSTFRHAALTAALLA